MDSGLILKTVARLIRKGYSEVNQGNIDPHIENAAEKTADKYPDFTADHFAIAINTDTFTEYILEYRGEGMHSVTNELALALDQVTPPSLDVKYQDAAREFALQLEREFSSNSEFAQRIQIWYSQMMSEQIGKLTETISFNSNDDLSLEEQRRLNNQYSDHSVHISFDKSDNPRNTLSDIGGYEPTVEYLKEQVIRPVQNREEYKINPNNKILFHGFAGSGARYFANATMGELGLPTTQLSPMDVSDQRVTRVINIIDRLFKKARNHVPCAIYFHEIDNIIGPSSFHNHGNHPHFDPAIDEPDDYRKPVRKFISEATADKNNEIILLASTYTPSLSDVPDEVKTIFTLLYTHMPHKGSRKQILKIHLESFDTDHVNVDKIADETENFTALDLKQLASRAMRIASQNSSEDGKVVQEDLEIALRQQEDLTKSIRERTEDNILGYWTEKEREKYSH